MSRICHAHCPPSAGLTGMAGVAAAGVSAAAVWSVAESVLTAIIVILGAAVMTGAVYLAYLLRRDSAALRASRSIIRAVPARSQAELPVRQPAAITGRRIVPGVVIKEKGAPECALRDGVRR